MSPVPAAALLGSLAALALIADRALVVGLVAAGLFAVCLRAPATRRLLYVGGTLTSALSVFLLSPFVSHTGYHLLWEGPKIPVLGFLDVTSEEIAAGGVQALRLAAVGLAFAAYALLLDLDRLLQAAGFVEALRGRGVEVRGLRGRARLLSPLVAGSLERSLNLAEAMEARGFGRPGRTLAPALPWSRLDRLALVVAVLLPLAAIWL